jgi:predicted nucleotidyltransferase
MEGITAKVAGYDDLVALKRQAARPSDLEDLERLRQARGE